MKRLMKWELLGFVWTGIMGVLLHFAYEWLGGGRAVALFAAVNESTWEHLKLLFVPEALFSIVEYWYIREWYPGLLWERVKGILLGMAAIVVGFYTYSGVWGNNISCVDIGLFFVGAGTVGWYVLRRREAAEEEDSWMPAIFVLAAVMLCFMVFTFRPPDIGLFWDPSV